MILSTNHACTHTCTMHIPNQQNKHTSGLQINVMRGIHVIIIEVITNMDLFLQLHVHVYNQFRVSC